MNDPTRLEKIALLTLAGLSIGVLAVIAFKALAVGSLDPNASALIGVIVTGLIAFSKDIIQAVRGYNMSAQFGKVTDQLAAAGPVTTDTPQPVVVANDQTNPVPVETKP